MDIHIQRQISYLLEISGRTAAPFRKSQLTRQPYWRFPIGQIEISKIVCQNCMYIFQICNKKYHLSVCLSVCRFIHPSIYRFIHPSIHPSIHPWFYLSIIPSMVPLFYLSIIPSIHLSIYISMVLSIHPSHLWFYDSVYLLFHPSIHPSIHPPIFLSIALSFYPSIHPPMVLSIVPSIHPSCFFSLYSCKQMALKSNLSKTQSALLTFIAISPIFFFYK